MNRLRNEFIFDSDDLFMFTSVLKKTPATEYTDSSLDVVLQDLNE